MFMATIYKDAPMYGLLSLMITLWARDLGPDKATDLGPDKATDLCPDKARELCVLIKPQLTRLILHSEEVGHNRVADLYERFLYQKSTQNPQ